MGMWRLADFFFFMRLIRSGSAEPVGGAARFQTLVNHYRSYPEYADQPALLTFFSGDAFNPSLESTVTKGRHMVPFLNEAGIDVACVGVSVAAAIVPVSSMAPPPNADCCSAVF
jgi:hypothetical protein